jgi:RimJ/RimL family protein N-acetyltransferase
MTNESLEKLIEIFSRCSEKERPRTLVSRGLISKHIIWVQVDNFDLQGEEPPRRIELSDYYLIKNEYNQIVGIIYDMKTDLHWVISPRFRGLGYLKKILKEEFLDFLFKKRKGRKIQITIEGWIKFAKQSEAVAKSVGFKLLGREKWSLSKANFLKDEKRLL